MAAPANQALQVPIFLLIRKSLHISADNPFVHPDKHVVASHYHQGSINVTDAIIWLSLHILLVKHEQVPLLSSVTPIVILSIHYPPLIAPQRNNLHFPLFMTLNLFDRSAISSVRHSDTVQGVNRRASPAFL